MFIYAYEMLLARSPDSDLLMMVWRRTKVRYTQHRMVGVRVQRADEHSMNVWGMLW